MSVAKKKRQRKKKATHHKKTKAHKPAHASAHAKPHPHHKAHTPHVKQEQSTETDEPTVDEELRNIYAIDAKDEDHVDMSKLEIVKQPIVRRILIAVLLILIAVGAGLIGALLLNSPFSTGQDQVLTFDINVSDTTIVSGREATFTIPYHNPSSVPLAELEVTLHTPEQFQLTSASPVPLSTDPFIWEVGTVAPNERGEIEVHGIFYETPGTAVTLQTVTRYAPANFSSPFEDIASESILITEGILQTSIHGPDRVVTGESVTYTVAVEHDEELVQNNVELRLVLPNGFSIDASSSEPSEDGQAVWTVPELGSSEPYTLEITGTFASDVEGTQQLLASAGIALQDAFIPLTEETFETDILASEFALSLIVNGQTGDSIVLPGDDLTVNVSLDNRGEETAEEITIELFIDNGLDRVNLGERSGIPNGDVYDNKINWDHTDMNRLETLRGGEDASIDVAIPVRTEGSTTIKLRAEATITTVGGIEISRLLNSSELTVRVASDLSGGATASYYDSDGSPLGHGPMPPVVGQETTYRVTWTVANALNDVEDLVMVAAIPSDATWAGLISSSGGTVTHDTVGNRVRWALGNLAAGAVPPTATFNMKVNPTSADLSTFLNLIGAASITATDTTTDSLVTTSAPALTSELPNDPYAENKGIVVE